MINIASTKEDDRELMEMAKKRVKAELSFKWHLLTYLLANAFAVIIYLTAPGVFWPIFLFAGWWLGLVVHFIFFMLMLADKTGTDTVTEEYNRLKQVIDTEIRIIYLRGDRNS